MKIARLFFTATLSLTACSQSRAQPPKAEAPSVAKAPAAPTPAEPPPIAVGTKMKCPVSGEEFTVKATTTQLTHAGKRYAFCCSDCKPEFEKNPAKYTK